VALLAGYGWLAAGGVAWIALALGAAGARDVALHAVALGFVFSMILGHAPIVIPAVARARVRFHAGFYVPLVLLHASLFVRLVLAPAHPSWRAASGIGNAAAIALFAVILVASLRASRPVRAGRAIMEGSNIAPCRDS